MNISNSFAILFVTLNCLLTYTSSEYRIVGGSPGYINDSPYLASIHFHGNYYCVGSLVTTLKVVTAANCVVDFDKRYLTVSAGVTDLRQIRTFGQTRNVVEVYPPCTYNPVTMHMDIAMLKVEESFILGPSVGTINFCACTFEAETPMTVSGWGWTTVENGGTSNILQTTTLTSLPHSECSSRYSRARKVFTSSMICAAGFVSDVCVRDFGTPGVVNGHLCAVASYNMGCVNPDYPTVFTMVFNTEVMDFLLDAIRR